MKKTAFITGSSRGIGKALAIQLAKDGFRVLLHGSRMSDQLKETARQIKDMGGDVEIFTADLTDLDQTQTLCKELPQVDVLILNASIQYRTPWQEIGIEASYEQLNCNFVSSMLLIQAVTPGMREKKWGRIITIGSVQEAKPHPDMLVYSASKAAQTNMMHSLSLQLAGDGITVNNIAPGVISTDRNAEALSDPIYAKKVADSIPAGYYGQPEDCAGAVSLLCGDAGRYITGQSLYIDGGKSIQ